LTLRSFASGSIAGWAILCRIDSFPRADELQQRLICGLVDYVTARIVPLQ
jgi:hypothetical protein